MNKYQLVLFNYFTSNDINRCHFTISELLQEKNGKFIQNMHVVFAIDHLMEESYTLI